MPPEVTLVLVGIISAAGLAIQQLIKATVNRRIKTMEENAEEARKDRELKRNAEMEKLRQETAKAQADAEQAKAIGENLVTLNSTMIKLIDTHVAEQHANRGVQSSFAETLGGFEVTVDKMASSLNDNTVVTRATGSKADNVVKVVEELKTIMTTGVDRIIQLLSEDTASEDKKIA